MPILRVISLVFTIFLRHAVIMKWSIWYTLLRVRFMARTRKYRILPMIRWIILCRSMQLRRRVMNWWRMLIQNCITFQVRVCDFLRSMVPQGVLIWHTLALQISCVKARRFRYSTTETASVTLRMWMILWRVWFVWCNMLLKSRVVRTDCQSLHTKYITSVTIIQRIFWILWLFFRRSWFARVCYLRIMISKHIKNWYPCRQVMYLWHLQILLH